MLDATAQIERNLALARPDLERLSGDRREAARLMFSTLADLEEIAVLAAERGDGIPGQLADELAHRETFARCAETLGGREPRLASVAAVIDFISQLHGSLSLAVLNVVGETWLENVFRAVATFGVADDMFRVVADEEKRHSHAALKLAKPDPEDALGCVRTLERLLYGVSVDVHFMYPLTFLGGVAAMGRLGKRNLAGHKLACKHLGIAPSHYAKSIGLCSKRVEEDEVPTAIELNPWERSAFAMGLGPMYTMIRFNRLPDRVEARLVNCVARALAEMPRLNRTVNGARREIYQCTVPVVGVRKATREGWIFTVYCKDQPSIEAVERHIQREAARARSLDYTEIPDMSASFKRLIPPARAAAIVSNVSRFGPLEGYGALSEIEGASISLFIGESTIGLIMDHRVHNGFELGQLAAFIKEHLED